MSPATSPVSLALGITLYQTPFEEIDVLPVS